MSFAGDQLANHFRATRLLARPQPEIRPPDDSRIDLKDHKGQESAKRALEVAAAGGHDLLLATGAMHLSARGYTRVFRVARTLAGLDGTDKVGRVHLADALSYRALADEMRHAA